MFLSSHCGTSEILHELMHALGFVHEQSRADRDNYLEINWENIEPAQIRQFQKVPDSMMEAMNGSEFDFNSIMLYRPNIFAKNPALPTMSSKTVTPIKPIEDSLSRSDIERLEHLYGHQTP
ncbi:MAG: hypothetical protein JWQ35_1552 [Bacteriovoracaceae bacterium]|nr:hypothetical protein [Bacteriovoracaceae bacterium]